MRLSSLIGRSYPLLVCLLVLAIWNVYKLLGIDVRCRGGTINLNLKFWHKLCLLQPEGREGQVVRSNDFSGPLGPYWAGCKSRPSHDAVLLQSTRCSNRPIVSCVVRRSSLQTTRPSSDTNLAGDTNRSVCAWAAPSRRVLELGLCDDTTTGIWNFA